MGFLFGLIVGTALSSGGDNSPRLPSSLSEIPFRCLAAIEQSDAAYRDCRRLSMAAQIQQQHDVADCQVSKVCRNDIPHAVDVALDYEIAALHQLESAAAKTQTH
jgi:hypothetical protein